MHINVLSQETINKIAAGEVVERPLSVVKELVENSIDAGATNITVEIKDGGTSLIRITDNGSGIDRSDIKNAFLRHATSKIKSSEDLEYISSLGFRGEALSSICAVSQTEIITKTKDSLTGTHYEISGGIEKKLEEVGAPNGTTIIVSNLFFNVPARKKFLKSSITEAGYISGVIEKLSLSHPEIAFSFINGGKTRLSTPGNNDLKTVIYSIYGKEVEKNLLPISFESGELSIEGFISSPSVVRGNRNFENYFINGRYIKNHVISKALEDAYAPYIMQHMYPFCVLNINLPANLIDVNIHPAKMEMRFDGSVNIYEAVYEAVFKALKKKELIPEMVIDVPKITEDPVPVPARKPEIFETERIKEENVFFNYYASKPLTESIIREEPVLLEKSNLPRISIIGQVFDTYWIIEYNEEMYIIDQHAAHEKVLFERFMQDIKNNEVTHQQLLIPEILELTISESMLLRENLSYFYEVGFEIEEFGGNEFKLCAVPAYFSFDNPKALFSEILSSIEENKKKQTPLSIYDRIATMSCKAAVKGNNTLSYKEAHELLSKLMSLDNPFNCPHGRPTMIKMSKYELEKKFKRIV